MREVQKILNPQFGKGKGILNPLTKIGKRNFCEEKTNFNILNFLVMMLLVMVEPGDGEERRVEKRSSVEKV